MFTYTSQPTILRAALTKRGVSREDLAYALDVSLRAVHRWLVEEENPNHRAMAPAQLQEVVYWLGGEGEVEFRFPRSMTGLKAYRLAEQRARRLAEEAKNGHSAGTEGNDLRAAFLAARARLASAKANALAYANPPAGQELPAWIKIVGDERHDPLFIIQATA
ncbi:MAG TPA: hypothetical protein PK959_06575 [Candidatus Competibacteraceae bacterium]|nr:hypothetical protein [Candidatus Competibacteraceae bacterium]